MVKIRRAFGVFERPIAFDVSVFVDDRGSEIALLAARALYRLNTGTNTWTNITLDPKVDALVRHAVSRRMRVEPRFLLGTKPGA